MDNLLEQRSALIETAESLTNSEDFSPEVAAQVDETLEKVRAIDAKIEVRNKLETFKGGAPSVIRSRGRVSSAESVQEHATREGWSFARAVDCVLKGRTLNGVEGEVQQELTRQFGSGKGHFTVPFGERRDLTTSTGAGLYPTITMPTVIDYLFALMVGPKVGVTVMQGLQGVVKLPRKSAAGSVASAAEQGTNATNPTYDSVQLSPKTVLETVVTSRRELMNSVVPLYELIVKEGMKEIATKIDNYLINGTGSSNQPTGVLNASGPYSLAAASNTIAYADVLTLIQKVNENNSASFTRAFVTSPLGHNKLQQTTKAGTFPVFISDGQTICGAPVVESSQVPNNLTVSAVSNLTALIYGEWSEVILGLYGGGIDVIVDEVSGRNGDVAFTFIADHDIALKHGASFAYCANFK